MLCAMLGVWVLMFLDGGSDVWAEGGVEGAAFRAAAWAAERG